jgi:hypothetical protein
MVVTRQELVTQLGMAMQAYQRSTQSFDDEVGRRLGLNPTDLRCLDWLVDVRRSASAQRESARRVRFIVSPTVPSGSGRPSESVARVRSRALINTLRRLGKPILRARARPPMTSSASRPLGATVTYERTSPSLLP